MTRKIIKIDNISQLPEVLRISKAWLFDSVTGWVLPEHRTQRGLEVWTSSPSVPGVSYLLVAPGEGDPIVPPPPPPSPLAVGKSIRASAEAAQRAAAQLYIDDPDARDTASP